MVEAVVQAPENADQFGTPPNPPLPIHLPQDRHDRARGPDVIAAFLAMRKGWAV